MSLDWHLSKIKDNDSLCWERDEDGEKDRMNHVTEMLIWGTMAVGLGGITDKNVGEWAIRLEMLKRCGRALGVKIDKETGKKGSFNPSIEDVRQHIGLYCNVKNETRTRFRTRLIKNVEADVVRHVEAELKKEKAA
jgi:hypothetical protein